MTEFYMKNCPHCNKQFESDGSSDEKCFWCHELVRPALKKLEEKIKMSETLVATNANDTISKTVPENPEPAVSPIPPKPDTTGLDRGKKAQAFHAYYETNKAAILADFDKLGENQMLKLWGIQSTTWCTLRARWMPERFQFPAWYGKRKKESDLPSPDGSTTEPQKFSREQRLAVVAEATALGKGGCSQVAKARNIPIKTLRAWVATASYDHHKSDTGPARHALKNKAIKESGLSEDLNKMEIQLAELRGWQACAREFLQVTKV